MATNAARIAELRKEGQHPASWVLVSFVGRAGDEDDGFTVYARPDSEYDWRWVVGLDLVVFARKGMAVADSLKRIRNACPKSLDLWDVDLKAGASVGFDFPAAHAEAHRRARTGTLGIELIEWSPQQCREFARQGF